MACCEYGTVVISETVSLYWGSVVETERKVADIKTMMWLAKVHAESSSSNI